MLKESTCFLRTIDTLFSRDDIICAESKFTTNKEKSIIENVILLKPFVGTKH